MSILDNREPQEPVAQKVCDFDPGTNSMIINYRCFKETLERAVQELEERKIPLGDATAQCLLVFEVFLPGLSGTCPHFRSRRDGRDQRGSQSRRTYSEP